MKIVSLGIIIVSLLIVTSYAKPVHADSTDPIQILDVHVEPDTLKINDTFLISATILNSSPYPIYLTSGSCTPAFSVSFDIHAKQVHPDTACTLEAIQQKVDPEGEITISNANKPGIIYQTVLAGTANANITIPYSAKNQTATDYSNIYYNASKSFTFLIQGANPISLISPKPTVNEILPLEQFKSGTPTSDVKCNNSLQLILKTEDGSPACVSSNTAQILIERGWALNYTNMTGKESISLSAYQGESIETFYNNGTVVSNFTINVNINNFKPSNALLILQIYYDNGDLYKAINVSSDTIQPDGFYKYQLTAVSDENHPPPFKVVATYNNATAITYAPVFAHP
ncbi:MAG: hypothetical protein ACREAT_04980 [Nitrosotalea sp.]